MWLCSVVNEAVIGNSIVCPPMEYTAYVFYINTERNRWRMHFNVTKKLDALIQVSPCTYSYFTVLVTLEYQDNFTRSKSRRSMMLVKRQLTFSFNFVLMKYY